MGDYRKLELWNRSHQLALAIYRATASFPVAEKYGLAIQIRRAASSIPMNIAEGCGRNTDPELCRFLRIALGSASELEYQILRGQDLEYLDHPTADHFVRELDEIKRMLASLIHRLQGRGRRIPLGHQSDS
jgi:four helix bundle protein